MRIYFCPECGSYDFGSGATCVDCDEPVPPNSWTDVSDEDFAQLDYVEGFDLPLGLPCWEYEVVRLNATGNDGVSYISHLLNSMGDKGWELINIVPLGGDGAQYGIFKRSWMEDL